ncbi:hypothetical protein B0H14DRAFT_3508306 [Mycena olivaceomarginata]|nr:hypothetical protein B0H14DRAFT_3508306 [Mycena olivaceomarginata]
MSTLESGKQLQYMRMIPGASANFSLTRRNFSGIGILSITTSTAQYPKYGNRPGDPPIAAAWVLAVRSSRKKRKAARRLARTLPGLDEDTAAEAVLPGGAQTSDDAQPSDDDALDDARSDDPEDKSKERPVGTYHLGGTVSEMHPTVKAARSALQGLVSQNLRTGIGVPGTIYPDFGVQRIDATTQERFLDPALKRQ